MPLIEKLEKIYDIKVDIRSAIQELGVPTTKKNFAAYADLIRSLKGVSLEPVMAKFAALRNVSGSGNYTVIGSGGPTSFWDDPSNFIDKIWTIGADDGSTVSTEDIPPHLDETEIRPRSGLVKRFADLTGRYVTIVKNTSSESPSLRVQKIINSTGAGSITYSLPAGVHNDYLWIHPGFVETARSPGADDGLAVWREDTYDHTQHDLKPIPYDDQVLESLIALMGSKTGVPLADEREERATVDEVVQLLIGVQGTETASPEGEVSVPSDDWWQPTQDETEWVPGEDDGSPVSTAEHDSQLDTSTSSNLDWLVSSLTSIIQGTADELGDYDVSESGLADTIESILTAGEGEATYEPKDEDEAESSYDDIVWDIGADDGRPTTTADEE